MLVGAVVLYLCVTIGIGCFAATRVHSAKDYLVAGHSLPLYMNLATVFATWFGAETALAASSTFIRDGLRGVIADPFGASSCLVIVALVFARRFYRLKLLTIGDFYRRRYNRTVEVSTSVAITLSYIGWASANLVALGICFSTLSQGAISLQQGIIGGAAALLLYLAFGGMFAIAFTDVLQASVVVCGLIYLAFLLAGKAGGVANVFATASESGKLVLIPSFDARTLIAAFGAYATTALGSIAQQDVFQRVTSAKDETTAMRGTLFGGLIYFVIAFVPMFIGMSAFLIDPEMVSSMLGDSTRFQLILPHLILRHAPLGAQVIFFGALMGAILSSGSGAILAPTAIFTENILRPIVGKRWGDKQMLIAARSVLVIFTTGLTIFALSSSSTMYEMVQYAYRVTLVSAFAPLVFGMFWRRATPQGALVAMICGLASWITSEIVVPDALFPPQLVGLLCSMAGMVAGSLAPQLRAAQGDPGVVDEARGSKPKIEESRQSAAA